MIQNISRVSLLLVLALWSITFCDWTMYKGNPAFTGSDTTEELNIGEFGRLGSINLGGRITASPVVYQGKSYVGTWSGRFYCIDNATFSIDWYAEIGRVQSSAACGNGLIVVGSENDTIYAFSKDSNIPVWKVATGGAVIAPVSYIEEKNRFYVGSFDRKFYAIDVSGNVCWTFDNEAEQDARYEGNASNKYIIEHGAPYLNGRFYIVTGAVIWVIEDNGTAANQVDTLLHHIQSSGHHSPVTMTPGLVQFSDTTYLLAARTWKERSTVATCRNLTSGEKISAGYAGAPTDHFRSTPASDLSGVYLCKPNYFSSVLKYSPDTRTKIEENTSIKQSRSGASLTRNHLVCQTEQGMLYVLNKSDLTVAYSHQITDTTNSAYGFRGSRSPAAISEGVVYFGADNGSFYCYGSSLPSTALHNKTKEMFSDLAVEISPNPFNPSVKINVNVIPTQSKMVTVSIYDVNGRKVSTFIKKLKSGHSNASFVWSGRDSQNVQVGSGVYVCHIKTGNRVVSRKIVLSE